jgi:hypothetical protein
MLSLFVIVTVMTDPGAASYSWEVTLTDVGGDQICLLQS